MSITDRFFEVAKFKLKATGSKLFDILESETDIKWTDWKNVYYEKQRIRIEMLEWGFLQWSELVHWIATGEEPYDEQITLTQAKIDELENWYGHNVDRIMQKEPHEWTDEEAEYIQLNSEKPERESLALITANNARKNGVSLEQQITNERKEIESSSVSFEFKDAQLSNLNEIIKILNAWQSKKLKLAG
jgi:hypothetical protein